jgi:hypothetical protein
MVAVLGSATAKTALSAVTTRRKLKPLLTLEPKGHTPLTASALVDAAIGLIKRSHGLGEIVERIAKSLGLSCLDEQNKLRSESPCAKRRNRLNAVTPGL